MKTKLGITTGILAALTYFVTLFQGFGIALMVLAGYILLAESDEWLKRMAIKAVVLTVTLSVLSWIIGLIPNAISVINSFIELFNGKHLYIEWLSDIINILQTIISFVENVLLILLGIKAVSKSTIYVPVVDDIVIKGI